MKVVASAPGPLNPNSERLSQRIRSRAFEPAKGSCGLVALFGKRRFGQNSRLDRAGTPMHVTRRKILYRRIPLTPMTRRGFSLLAAKKRPNHRPFLSFSIRCCQLSAPLPIRSRISASSAEIRGFPSRKSRPV